MRRFLLAYIAFVLLTQSLCAARRSRPVVSTEGLDVINPHITFIHTAAIAYNQDRWNPVITRIIKEFLVDAPCQTAFIAAGINLKTLFDTGLVIAGSDALNSYSGEELTLTGYARSTGQHLVNDRHVPAFTTTNFEGLPLAVTDGKPHIFLNQQAFSGGEQYLREVLAHELIHAAGFPPKMPGLVGRLLGKQDLSYMGEPFQKILRECAER